MAYITVTAQAAPPYEHIVFTHSVNINELGRELAETLAYTDIEGQIADFEMYLEEDATPPDFDMWHRVTPNPCT